MINFYGLSKMTYREISIIRKPHVTDRVIGAIRNPARNQLRIRHNQRYHVVSYVTNTQTSTRRGNNGVTGGTRLLHS